MPGAILLQLLPGAILYGIPMGVGMWGAGCWGVNTIIVCLRFQKTGNTEHKTGKQKAGKPTPVGQTSMLQMMSCA